MNIEKGERIHPDLSLKNNPVWNILRRAGVLVAFLIDVVPSVIVLAYVMAVNAFWQTESM